MDESSRGAETGVELGNGIEVEIGGLDDDVAMWLEAQLGVKYFTTVVNSLVQPQTSCQEEGESCWRGSGVCHGDWKQWVQSSQCLYERNSCSFSTGCQTSQGGV